MSRRSRHGRHANAHAPGPRPAYHAPAPERPAAPANGSTPAGVETGTAAVTLSQGADPAPGQGIATPAVAATAATVASSPETTVAAARLTAATAAWPGCSPRLAPTSASAASMATIAPGGRVCRRCPRTATRPAASPTVRMPAAQAALGVGVDRTA